MTVSLDSTASLASGVVFAREYQIVRPLAEGGMGVVYVALQLGTMKQRALKVMRPSIVKDPRNRDRFLLEARAGASLQTDHVVDVIGAGIDEASGAPWLAMELLEGETLADAVEKRGAMSMRDTRECLDQLRHALTAAHAAGLVHRDLKPENLFLATPRRADARFTLKVLDFGIAKTLDGVTAASTSTAAGSPMWMTPEQANAQPVSTATDVWPLGLIAFWMLTGRYYWESPYGSGATLASLLTEILIAPMEAPSARASRSGVASRLPFGFDEWFARCVVRDPALRFRDGGEALRAVIDLLDRHIASAQGAELFPTIASSPGALASWRPPAMGASTPPPQGMLPATIASMTGTQAPVTSSPGWSGANATPQPGSAWSTPNSAPGAVWTSGANSTPVAAWNGNSAPGAAWTPNPAPAGAPPWNAQAQAVAPQVAGPWYGETSAPSASGSRRTIAIAVVAALIVGAGASAWLLSAGGASDGASSPGLAPPQTPQIPRIPQTPPFPTMPAAIDPPGVPGAPPFVPSAPQPVPSTPVSPAIAAEPPVAQPNPPSRRSTQAPSRSASQPAPHVPSSPIANAPPSAPMPSAPAPVPTSPPSGSRTLPPVTGRTAAIAALCDTADRLDSSGNHAAAQQIRSSAWGHLRSIESQVQSMQTSDPASAEMLRAAAAEERAYLTARLGHP